MSQLFALDDSRSPGFQNAQSHRKIVRTKSSLRNSLGDEIQSKLSLSPIKKPKKTESYHALVYEELSETAKKESVAKGSSRLERRRVTNVHLEDQLIGELYSGQFGSSEHTTPLELDVLIPNRKYEMDYSGVMAKERVDWRAQYNGPIEEFVYPTLQLGKRIPEDILERRAEMRKLHGTYGNHRNQTTNSFTKTETLSSRMVADSENVLSSYSAHSSDDVSERQLLDIDVQGEKKRTSVLSQNEFVLSPIGDCIHWSLKRANFDLPEQEIREETSSNIENGLKKGERFMKSQMRREQTLQKMLLKIGSDDPTAVNKAKRERSVNVSRKYHRNNVTMSHFSTILGANQFIELQEDSSKLRKEMAERNDSGALTKSNEMRVFQEEKSKIKALRGANPEVIGMEEGLLLYSMQHRTHYNFDSELKKRMTTLQTDGGDTKEELRTRVSPLAVRQSRRSSYTAFSNEAPILQYTGKIRSLKNRPGPMLGSLKMEHIFSSASTLGTLAASPLVLRRGQRARALHNIGLGTPDFSLKTDIEGGFDRNAIVLGLGEKGEEAALEETEDVEVKGEEDNEDDEEEEEEDKEEEEEGGEEGYKADFFYDKRRTVTFQKKEVAHAFSPDKPELLSQQIELDSLVFVSHLKDRSIPAKTMREKVEHRRKHAEDVLLSEQLRKGLLPERLIKRPLGLEDCITLDLCHYSIGDELGNCLASALKDFGTIDTLGLRDNRLTALSLPRIIKCLDASWLRTLDLSENKIQGDSIRALVSWINCTRELGLITLDLNRCALNDTDAVSLLHAFSSKRNNLLELGMSHNRIGDVGASAVKCFLLSSHSSLRRLELVWNKIGPRGAEEIAAAVQHCRSIHHLDLSHNTIGDIGAQKIAASLATNSSLEELILKQNKIGSKACFVFSTVLGDHSNMMTLDLSSNPLGNAGARSLFRSILRGINCFVALRDCDLSIRADDFNYANPSVDSPYLFDVSEPYQAAVLSELVGLVRSHDNDSYFEHFGHKESINGPERHLPLPADGDKWTQPVKGFVNVNVVHKMSVPTTERAISQSALEKLIVTLVHVESDFDREKWFNLLAQDNFFTTNQVQLILDELSKHKLLEVGGLTKISVMAAVWDRLVNAKDVHDFLCHNLDAAGRQRLVVMVSVEKFKFSWANPTAHWRLDLGNKDQRQLMLNLIAIDSAESVASQDSGRGDTSQNGNWSNFRNGEIKNQSNTVILDKECILHLPDIGIAEFDYVSTTRSAQELLRPSSSGLNSISLSRPGSSRLSMLEHSCDGQRGDELANTGQSLGSSNKAGTPKIRDTGNPRGGSDRLQSSSKASRINSALELCRDDKLVTLDDDQLKSFLFNLGLSPRRRINRLKSSSVVLELQLAATKHHFLVEDCLVILECFDEDHTIQTRAITALFARIADLENFHIIMRMLPQEGVEEVASRLGWLNFLNPHYPAYDVKLNMAYKDERVVAVLFLQLGAAEGGDAIKENVLSEISLIDMYASMSRLLDTAQAKILQFTYREIGERQSPPNWALRREYTAKTLLGTLPIPIGLSKAMLLYKKLEIEGALSRGPLDLQFKRFEAERARQAEKGGNLLLTESEKKEAVRGLRARAGIQSDVLLASRNRSVPQNNV
jgi:Ran GTPase-activating protein (RanGAP) involved in mRNA processing and transport